MDALFALDREARMANLALMLASVPPARFAGARGEHKVLVIDHVKNVPN
jgi:hypothetical protein